MRQRLGRWGAVTGTSTLLVFTLLISCTPPSSEEALRVSSAQPEGTAVGTQELGVRSAWRLFLDGSFVLAPDRVGPVDSSAGRLVLAEVLGEESIRDAEIYLGEGMCAPGSRLFPGTLNEVEIIWADSTRSRPAEARVRTLGSEWRTPRGLTVGTSLKDLEQWAGDVVMFSGFGWDYGGGATWTEEVGDFRIRLLPGGGEMEEIRSDPDAGDVMGDRLVRSDHPLIRRVTIRVAEISWVWGPALSTADCG